MVFSPNQGPAAPPYNSVGRCYTFEFHVAYDDWTLIIISDLNLQKN